MVILLEWLFGTKLELSGKTRGDIPASATDLTMKEVAEN
jgi:hypothetical protein